MHSGSCSYQKTVMKLFEKREKTLMSGKFYSMLLGGTLTMIVFSVMLMSDSVIAGFFVGSDAVAGVTLVSPMYSLAAFLGSVFALGIPIVYSEEMGKFNKRGADQTFGFGLLMAIGVGVLLLVLTTLFGDVYLQSSRPPDSVLAQARGYLQWMRLTFLLFPVYNFLLEAVYSDGDETLCTIANVVQCAGNIAVSIVLSRVIGIQGVALASFLFASVALLILFTHFLKKSNSLRLNLYFSLSILKDVTQYSIVDASSYLFFSMQIAILNVFVSARYGANYLILVSVIMLNRQLQLVFDGVGEAITPIISVYLGEKCYSGVSSTYKLAERTAIAEGVAVTLIVFLCAPFIPRILDITDPALIRLAATETRLVALGSVFVSLLYLLSSYYPLIEKIPLGLAVCALRDVLPAIPFAVLSGMAFGVYGLFAGMAAAPAASYALVLAYIAQRHGRENCPLFLGSLKGGIRSELFNVTTEPEQIMDLQQKVARLLKEHDYDHRTISCVELLIEELYMLIREKNGGKAILSECSVLLRPDGVQIITKDDGVIFDISEENAAVTSLNAYVVAAYMEKLGPNKRYLTTMSFNRSSFLIKKQAV